MNKPAKYIYSSLVFFFLYLPLMVVMMYSFNNADRSLLWHGFTYRWYVQLVHDDAMIKAAIHSVMIGLTASTTAAILGTIAATALYKYRFAGRKLLIGLSFLLIIAPDIILAIALLTLFSFFKLTLGFWTLLLSHITFCVPFVTIIVHNKLREVDPFIFEAAKDLGASDSTLFIKILVPLIAPAIFAGWLISLTLSLDDVIISFFTTGPSFQILPLRIYAMARMGVSPELNALSTIMLLVTIAIVILSQFLFNRDKQ